MAAMKRLDTVLSNLHPTIGSENLMDHKCKSNQKDDNVNWNAKELSQSFNSEQIHLHDVEHLDHIIKKKKGQLKLKRYANKWVRSREKIHNLGYLGFIDDDEVVLYDIVRGKNTKGGGFFKRSGARKEIVWSVGEVRAAIVTCGGLCPGLNNVITGLFNCLYYNYGVNDIYGIDAGYTGFWHNDFRPWKRLTPDTIAGINEHGGTKIRTDRGGFRNHEDDIINSLLIHGVNQVYIIGGDGTHRAANILQKKLAKRQLKITVAGIPKTIDNDIGIIDRSFGFTTSVAKAKEAVLSAITESKCTPKGVGIIKVMGRHAGFIACFVTLACHDIDLCMIPEIDFELEGPTGILPHLHHAISRKGYAVMVVAEGSGSTMLPDTGEVDKAGNKIQPDIGEFLQKRIKDYFKDKFADGNNVRLKYHDPGYLVRSVPANADDAILCMILASNAVHNSMAGYTGFTSGIVNNKTVMIPIETVTAASPASVRTMGRTWTRVLAQTHQPRQKKNL